MSSSSGTLHHIQSLDRALLKRLELLVQPGDVLVFDLSQDSVRGLTELHGALDATTCYWIGESEVNSVAHATGISLSIQPLTRAEFVRLCALCQQTVSWY